MNFEKVDEIHPLDVVHEVYQARVVRHPGELVAHPQEVDPLRYAVVWGSKVTCAGCRVVVLLVPVTEYVQSNDNVFKLG